MSFEPTVPNAIHRAEELFGSEPYIVTSKTRVTFGEMAHSSATLAKALLALGTGKGTRVGVLLPSGPDWIAAWLAVGRIGALAMPLSTLFQPAELVNALRLGDVDTLIVASDLFGRDQLEWIEAALPDLSEVHQVPFFVPAVPYLRRVLVLGESQRAWATGWMANDCDPGQISDELLRSVEEQVAPADVLNVIFTSGTSAAPKAVVHTQGSVVRKASSLAGCGGYPAPGLRMFVGMPFFWVGGLLAVMGSLLAGSTIVTQPRFDAEEALTLMEKEQVNSLTAWPTIIERLRTHPSLSKYDLSSLPMLTSAWNVPSDLRHSQLGMTETLGAYSANPRDGAPEEERTLPLPERLRGSSGALLPFHEIKVIDPKRGGELPEGQEGEFCVRGYGLMSTLYKCERHEVFDRDGWYHTGDKGFLRDGYVFFTGRLSDAIKCRGANVSPREVVAALEAFPEVEAAFVVGIPDPVEGERVAAVIVPAAGADVSSAEIVRNLRANLSSFKVPSVMAVVAMEAIPWLASGKPDLLRLRELAMNGHAVTEG